MNNVIDHPTSYNARSDRDKARENLARQLRTNQMMRESARERINASAIIDEIGNLDIQLKGSHTEGTKEVVDKATGEITVVKVETPIPLDKDIINALKARVDIKFRLLNKVLPDLKSTESISHNVHDHSHTIHNPVSNVELATRIQFWQKDIKRRTPVLIEHNPIPPESVVNDTIAEYDWL